MHAHICPRCRTDFEHEKFVPKPTWSPLQLMVARELHRFYGACQRCIFKFMESQFSEANWLTAELKEYVESAAAHPAATA